MVQDTRARNVQDNNLCHLFFMSTVLPMAFVMADHLGGVSQMFRPMSMFLLFYSFFFLSVK